MDGPVPRWRKDERSISPEYRRHVGRCLRHAFPVAGCGSFTGLVRAIGDDSARQAKEG
jgi:hypothetical protein